MTKNTRNAASLHITCAKLASLYERTGSPLPPMLCDSEHHRTMADLYIKTEIASHIRGKSVV